MADHPDEQIQQGPPQPDPALRALDQFVGTWRFRGHLLGSDEENIVGQATYYWLDGGFFLVQDIEIDFAGMFHVKSHELIGHDAETGAFSSLVFSNMSPAPLPYRWDVQGRDVTISVAYPPLDATFTGRYSEDGTSFAGGWRPNTGADETVNVPYDISGERVD
jgi:Protein of unknown function (DUF1579)